MDDPLNMRPANGIAPSLLEFLLPHHERLGRAAIELLFPSTHSQRSMLELTGVKPLC